MTAHAEITLEPPPEVSINLNSDGFNQLMATRNDLLTQFETTQEKIGIQAKDCHDVAEGSPKVSDCKVEAQEVITAVRSYRAALARFKASLAASVSLQQFGSGMDNKLPPLPARHNLQPISIESHGDFHVVMADGRKLTGKEATRLAGDDEVKLVTGSDGGAVLKLSNNTQVTLGPNTELNTNVPDPSPGATKGTMSELVKGTLQWYHEVKKQLFETDMESAADAYGKIHMEAVIVGVRGTRFDCAVLSDGSGYIKLYSGAVDLTPQNGGKIVKLRPGQMVTIRGGEISKPVPIR
ncbi:MAG: FecR domain-containing protein [Betaproteobacteria bacterium]|nr:FecR domain-containing protein [Betaproteobacteria bacterium]